MSSGGPPHHPHNRQVPNANAAAAWNHMQAQLQVPNYFPRQPQAAHTHPVPTTDHTMHPAHQIQPTWHTPTTTEAMKILPNIQHTHMLNEMLKQEGLFRAREGVDLSLARNGNQNGELSTAPHPISLSVRDTNKINSLSGLDIQAVSNSAGMKATISPSLSITPSVPVSPGLKSVSPGLKTASPGLKSSSPSLKTGSPSHKSHSPAPKSGSPGLGTNLGGLLSLSNIPNLPAAFGLPMDPSKSQKRSNIRVDSILERLNPAAEKVSQDNKHEHHQGFSGRPDLHSASVTRADVPNKLPEAHQYAIARKQAEMLASLQGGLNAESLNPAALANMQRFLEMAMSKNVMPDLSHVLRSDLPPIKPDNTTNITKDNFSSYVPPTSNTIDKNKSQIIVEKDKVDKKFSEKDISKGEKDQQLPEKETHSGVIAHQTTNFDENSNSSSTANVPTPVKEDDSGSMHSNDSLDSTKSRRKRKPSKTIKVLAKEDEMKDEKEKLPNEEFPTSQPSRIPTNDNPSVDSILEVKGAPVIPPSSKIPERRRSSDDLDALISPTKTRRKTSSESETIDNIAALVQEGLQEKRNSGDGLSFLREIRRCAKDKKSVPVDTTPSGPPTESKPVTVSVIKSKDNVVIVCESSSNVLKDEVDGIEEDTISSAPLKKDSSEIIKETAREISRSSPVMTPAQKKVSSTPFLEVENKLEEMFAGIMSEPPSQPSTSTLNGDSLKSDLFGHSDIDSSLSKLEDSAADTSEEHTKADLPTKGKRSRPISRQCNEDEASRAKKRRFIRGKTSASNLRKPSKSPSTVSTVLSPSTKTKRLPTQSATTTPSSSTPKVNSKSDPVKDVYAYDSGSNASSSRSRGPFVQIKGHRDSPVSVSIVNTPLNVDDDGEKKLSKSKKFHDDSEYRHKVRSKGLHCSTLSNKYDAQTKDTTWICAFCKRGPHASEMSGPTVISETSAAPQGDLFGPYFITTQCPEFEKRLDDPYDRQFKSKKIGKILDVAALGPAVPNKSKNKSKRKHSESSLDPLDVYLGITSTGQDSYEVWAHEDCLVWSQGIYLVGPKIVGLEEAVWSCCNVCCTICGLRGANICCIKRGCLNMAHLCCARSNGWQFDQEQFKAFCLQHTSH